MIIIKEKLNLKKIVAIIVFIAMILILQTGCTEEIKDLNEDLDNIAGENTEEILGKSVDVTLGEFQALTGKNGFTNTKLQVDVKNKTSETKSFSIQIEAVDATGKGLDTDFVYANNLTGGQSQTFEVFTYVSDEQLESIKNATFKIVEVSMY